MKRLVTLIPFLALCLTVGAQEMANIGKTINVISPEVNGKTVTFRLEAPDARSVQVNGTMNKEYTIVNHYGADGRRSDSVQLLPDGSRYVTTYGYGDVYVYTP